MLITLWPPLWCLGGRDSDSNYENPYVLGTIAPYHHQPSSTNSSFEHCSHEENGMKGIHWPRLNHMARKSYTCPQFMQCSAPNLLVIASVLDLQFQFIMCCMYIYIYRACRVPYITVHLQRADRTCHVDMCEDCNSFTTHMQRVPPLHTVTLGDICLSWSQNMISSWPTGKKQPIGQIAAVCASAPKNVIFFCTAENAPFSGRCHIQNCFYRLCAPRFKN